MNSAKQKGHTKAYQGMQDVQESFIASFDIQMVN